MIPLAAFALVVVIVAIVHLMKIRDVEIDCHQRLRFEEMEHQRKMRELELELEQVRRGK
jgi:hypothetical protein